MGDHVNRVIDHRQARLDAGSVRLRAPPRPCDGAPDSLRGADGVKAPIHPGSDRRSSPDRSAGSPGPPPPFRRGPDPATDRIFLPSRRPVFLADTGGKPSCHPTLGRVEPTARFQPNSTQTRGNKLPRAGGKRRPSVLVSVRYGCTRQKAQHRSEGVGPPDHCISGRAIFAKNTGTRRHSGEAGRVRKREGTRDGGAARAKTSFYLGELQ